MGRVVENRTTLEYGVRWMVETEWLQYGIVKVYLNKGTRFPYDCFYLSYQEARRHAELNSHAGPIIISRLVHTAFEEPILLEPRFSKSDFSLKEKTD